MSDPKPPTVSVVIPAYNAEDYIGEAVSSVLAQTLEDFELLVIDDGSTDATAEVVSGFSDDRVRLVRGENEGASRARNRGIALSRAPWIAMLDSDDYWGPSRLEFLVDAAQSQRVDMIADNLVLINEAGVRQGEYLDDEGIRISGPATIDALEYLHARVAGYETPRAGLFKPLYRRAFLSEHSLGFPEDVAGPEDYYFYCHCLLRGARFVVLPEAHYYYRLRPGSLSRASAVRFLESQRRGIVHLIEDEHLPPALRPGLQRALAETDGDIAFHRLWGALREREWIQAVRLSARSPAGISRVLRTASSRIRERAISSSG